MYGYKDNKSAKGAILNSDGQVLAETYICCHCGFPFYYHLDSKKRTLVNPGGHKYSHCFDCDGVTCGRKKCDIHIPIEAKLEYSEALGANQQRAVRKLLTRYPDIEQVRL